MMSHRYVSCVHVLVLLAAQMLLLQRLPQSVLLSVGNGSFVLEHVTDLTVTGGCCA